MSGLPGVVVYAIFSGSSKPMTSLYVFEDAGIGRNITLMTSLLCLAFGFLYYVVIPWRVYPGQTIGKKITHIKIVRRDGKPLNLGMLILRQFVFLVFIEGLATATSTYVKVFLTITTKFYVDGYLTIIWFALTVMSMFLLFWNHQHLALHDRVLGTTVILLTGNK
ncbi:hypothetical protein FD19_GL000395 [Lacticaseibacillus thailandensis DSM 22698 = JCM 13996]|uniref:RDD domain-containing protein n=1 Tax=Lacticaseibacillus thailandensis DSM 22698 = JCM 13996 TaxID=1423810 RepID=A0A0R2C9P7_9LACO|nr:hypothetical protein FD19_GL000395 [Lacticaseibacillus thailandensis DSM 22698 = JCM 13996]